jgi:hypothetical protein
MREGELWSVTPLSTICQFYWWRESEKTKESSNEYLKYLISLKESDKESFFSTWVKNSCSELG